MRRSGGGGGEGQRVIRRKGSFERTGLGVEEEEEVEKGEMEKRYE